VRALLCLALVPCAAAAATLEIAPESPRPGDPVVVTVRGCSDASGTLGPRTLHFYALAGGARALTGLPVEQEPGDLIVDVACGASHLKQTLTVQPAAWRVRERELKVAKGFVAPSARQQRRMDEDKHAFEAAWAQPFGPPLFKTGFAAPRKANITAPFGDKRMFNGKLESQHYGTDFDGKVGAPIVAANAGRVVMARENFASGRTVIIDHGAGLLTAYFHMSKIEVKQGQIVKRGQRLGKVGKTGRVTGPHLHFAAHVDGLYVDPETLLKLELVR
jgi:murein DD-endopeptidase MepM/ murein hydrolase activator NlpD